MFKATLKKLSASILFFYILIIFIALPAVILSFTENYGFAGAAANALLLTGIVWWLASLSPKIGRTIWLMFPLMFFAAFQIVLLDLFGRSVIAVDMFLNLVTTNAGEVAELLSNMLPAIAFVVIVYVPQLVAGVIFIRRHTALKAGFLKVNRRIGASVTGAGLIFLIIAEFTSPSFAIADDIYPVNVFYNVYLAADRSVKTARYHETSADFRFAAADTDTVQSRKVVLLVIGETSRASDWQLCGYDRPTNPRLSKIDGLFVAPRALSESNTTHKSVPMLLSAADALSYDSIYHIKSIITAFKEAGYSTAFFSNQRHNGSFIDFFGMEADTVSFLRDGQGGFDGFSPDSRLLGSLSDILSRGNRRQLIVLHTYGSHFNYNDRYAREDSVFGPVDYPETSKKYRRQLLNAYDNTIVATDRFLARTIEMIDSAAPRSVMLYTSDHGEDIYDDENNYFLHASPLPTIEQVHVPLLVFFSEGYRAAMPGKVAAVAANIGRPVSTSRSFFHTALDLGTVSTGVFDPAASLADKKYQPREQLYLNDHNLAVMLGEVDGIKME